MKYRIQLPVITEKRGWSQLLIMVEPKQEKINECTRWCMETMGTEGWQYHGQYSKIPYEFRFKRGEDLVAFKLVFGL